MSILEKLLEGIVIERKGVHRVDVKIIIQVDPAIFDVKFASFVRRRRPFTSFCMITAVTNQ